jgi:curli production assembly/transport component CsgG|tara:strand:- start:7204 stop:8043 length:840 start_codon:yes stop_codon:yes gene_type:complete
MEVLKLFYLLTILCFSVVGCVAVPLDSPTSTSNLLYVTLEEVTPPIQKVPIAVYSFTDMTGQRKPGDGVALISTAVTQGAHIWLLQSLKRAGHGKWFMVVERVALDNLLKERQIIRQTRETEGDKDNLSALLFAGVIVEGGIVGYDTNTKTGGIGARLLGIGVQDEFREDRISVGIRLVSVSSGEVLLAISSEKTILSSRMSATVFRFLDVGTKLLEIEAGYTENESVSYAVRKAIDKAVYDMIEMGIKQGLWKFKEVQKTPIPSCDNDLSEVPKKEQC